MKSIYAILILVLAIQFSNAQDCLPPENISISSEYTVSWNSVDGATEYIIEYREAGTIEWFSFDNILTTNYAFEHPVACLLYELRVVAVCGSNTQSAGSDIITTMSECGGGSCDPSIYCQPFQDNQGEFLESFRIDQFENISGMDNESYTDYSQYSILLEPGKTYEIEMTPGFSATEFSEVMAIYIDLNGDGEFDEISEQLFLSDVTSTTVTGTIEIPAQVDISSTILRAILSYSSLDNACAPGYYGETEDYCVTFESPCDKDFDFQYIELLGEVASFDWLDFDEMFAFNYRYKKTSEDDDQWEYFATVQNELLLDELDQCSEYEIEIRAVCAADTSAYKYNTVFNSFCPTAVVDVDYVDFNLYPNPWANQMTINLDLEKSLNVRIIAYDILGKPYTLKSLQTYSAGLHNIHIDESLTANMSNGLYIISVETASEKLVSRKTIKL